MGKISKGSKLIILARHGQTEWNKVKRVQGWKNSPLTELGKLQAKNVAEVIAKIAHNNDIALFSSPLGRAYDTARIISNKLASEVSIEISPLLKEYSYGDWEGLSLNEVKEQRPEEWKNRKSDKWNYVVSGGESYYMVSERAKAWLDSLPKNRIIIAVSHQMIGRTIRGSYLGLSSESTMSLAQENNEIVILKDGAENILVA